MQFICRSEERKGRKRKGEKKLDKKKKICVRIYEEIKNSMTIKYTGYKGTRPFHKNSVEILSLIN